MIWWLFWFCLPQCHGFLSPLPLTPPPNHPSACSRLRRWGRMEWHYTCNHFCNFCHKRGYQNAIRCDGKMSGQQDMGKQRRLGNASSLLFLHISCCRFNRLPCCHITVAFSAIVSDLLLPIQQILVAASAYPLWRHRCWFSRMLSSPHRYRCSIFSSFSRSPFPRNLRP